MGPGLFFLLEMLTGKKANKVYRRTILCTPSILFFALSVFVHLVLTLQELRRREGIQSHAGQSSKLGHWLRKQLIDQQFTKPVVFSKLSRPRLGLRLNLNRRIPPVLETPRPSIRKIERSSNTESKLKTGTYWLRNNW